MRHLLLASVTLLAFACGSAPDRSQWTADVSQGCYVRPSEASVAGGNRIAWDGRCWDGDAIGPGTLRWVQNDGTIGYHRTCLRPEHPQARCSLGGGM